MSNNFLVVLLLLVPLVELVQCTGNCAADYKEYNGRCYKAVKEAVTEQEAEAACHKDGGQLASIHSKDENEFIRGHLDSVDSAKTARFYIGLKLKRVHPNEKLVSAYWTDGSAMGFGDPVVGGNGTYPWGNYRISAKGPEPNNENGGETCVLYGHDDNSHWSKPITVGWVDEKCISKNAYVCKK